MANNELLTRYQELFCEYVGSYGHTPLEAYCKAYNVIGEPSDRDRILARNLSNKKLVKERISFLRETVNKKAIDIASNKVAFDKSDAMINIQNILMKSKRVLDSPTIDGSDLNRLTEIMKSNLKLTDVYEDGIKVESKDFEDIKFYNNIMQLVQRPDFDSKTAEILLKANRQACEIYDLLNTNVTLKAGDATIEAINTLKNLSLDDLAKLASGEE